MAKQVSKGGMGLIYRSYQRQEGADIHCRGVNDIRGMDFNIVGTAIRLHWYWLVLTANSNLCLLSVIGPSDHMT